MVDKFNIPLIPLMKIYDTPKMKENMGREWWVHYSLPYTFSFRCNSKLCFQFMSILKSYLTNFWTLSCLISFVGVVSHLIWLLNVNCIPQPCSPELHAVVWGLFSKTAAAENSKSFQNVPLRLYLENPRWLKLLEFLSKVDC